MEKGIMITYEACQNRKIKIKKKKKKKMGENRLQKSSDLFHLGRTWFKLEAELKSSVFTGFLTAE